MFKFLVFAFAISACHATTQILPRLNGRIVGGEDATIQQYPYQLSLLFNGNHICGASIIDEYYAVTAAHCTSGSEASSLSIRAGSAALNSGGTVINVKAIHQNPKYNATTVDYDISVLELAKPLSFGSKIKKIDLPNQNENVAIGIKVNCTGWGATTEGGYLSTKLQVVTVNTIGQRECRDAYGSSAITDRMVCAGVGGKKDACQGDSGGPLVSLDKKLIGIVSWGYGCARPSHPGVYSRVSALRDYITETTGI
ncbi:PREDICTED: trypsin-1-like [Nicrophorus vespilloides]|uniref:Trypsin-1-like n=1 Tax=Nicrophorus vespilloides TaxID=110193 RepID=A0ABM1MH41_NICVS|nr:PREDICTED: trypsin-1-like [Nicrophorus vespilloides]